MPSEEMSTLSDSLPNGTVLKPDGRVRVKKSVMKRLQRREMVRIFFRNFPSIFFCTDSQNEKR
jgi:hypothetical protein